MSSMRAALWALTTCATIASSIAKEQCDSPLSLMQQNVQVHRHSADGIYGSDDCQCIGIDDVKGQILAKVGDKQYVPYPADLGAHCKAWDKNSNPNCPGADWCEEKWCYVDPCKCKNVAVLPKPSNYLPKASYQGHPLHFSYVTCGGKDSYSGDDKKKTEDDIKATCAVEVDSEKWGSDKCRCVGVGPQRVPSTMKVIMGVESVDVPADTGAYCKAWEGYSDPACKGESAPAYCTEKWCYVDPCSCDVDAPPKTTSYLPKAKNQGHAVYYSYESCGGTDAWTGKHAKKACVNQKSEDDCTILDKCGWTGTECLGKELVSVCKKAGSGTEDSGKSGSWTPKVFVAMAVALLCSFH